MKIGQRLGRALDRAGKSQREVAVRAEMEEATISKIVTGKTPSPFFGTIEKIVKAAGLTWGELFEEPQMRLSDVDARVARDFREVLDRIIDNDAKQKKRISARSGTMILRDAPRSFDEVDELDTEPIPGEYQRIGANRVYRVRTAAVESAQVELPVEAADHGFSVGPVLVLGGVGVDERAFEDLHGIGRQRHVRAADDLRGKAAARFAFLLR